MRAACAIASGTLHGRHRPVFVRRTCLLIIIRCRSAIPFPAGSLFVTCRPCGAFDTMKGIYAFCFHTDFA